MRRLEAPVSGRTGLDFFQRLWNDLPEAMDYNLIIACLFILVYLSSCVSLTLGLATRFQDPMGRLRMMVPTRTAGSRFLKALLLFIAGFMVLIYLGLSILSQFPLPLTTALIMGVFLGLFINSLVLTLFPPVIQVGSDGIRFNRTRVPWEEIIHWERARYGLVFYRFSGERHLTRAVLPLAGRQLGEAEQLFTYCARQIPVDGASPLCVACGVVNPMGETQCASCRQPLVNRVFLDSQSARVDRRRRWTHLIYFVIFMVLVFAALAQSL